MNEKMTIFELVEAKVAAEAKLYNDAFDLGRYAGEAVTKTAYEGIASALGDGEARKVRANDMHNAARELRDELLAKTLKVNEEFDRVKQQRQESLEEAIDPEDAGTGELLQAAMAGSEQLTSLADLALSIGNDDGVLLALRVGRQRGMEDVEAYIRTVRPDLNEICAELDHIEEIPGYDPDDVEARFEGIARGVPSREELLIMIG